MLSPRSRIAPHALAIAIASALLFPHPILAQQVVADGDTQNPAAGDYVTTEPVDAGGTAGYAFYALNGGAISPLGGVSLSTSGNGAAAAHATGIGSQIDLGSATIRTTGNSAAGLSATEGGVIRAVAGGLAVRTEGSNSDAVKATQNARIELFDAVLETHGNFSNGLNVLSGAQVSMTGGSITNHQSGTYAVQADGGSVRLDAVQIRATGGEGILARNGGRIDGDGVTIITEGHSRAGARVQAGAELHLSNSRIETHGDASIGVGVGGLAVLDDVDIISSGHGVSVDGRISHADIRNSRISTTQAAGDGVLLADNAKATITNTRIDSAGLGVNVNGYGATAVLDRVEIYTTGRTALWAPNASTVQVSHSHLQTSADNAVALDNRASQVSLNDTRLVTAGASSHGLYASQDTGSGRPIITGQNVDVHTTGFGGIGAVARLGGIVNLEGGQILTTGDKAYGVLSGGAGGLTLKGTHVRTEGAEAWGAVINDKGRLEIDGGSLVSAQHGAIWARSLRELRIANGAQLMGGNGTLMAFDATVNGTVALAFDNDVQARGDIIVLPVEGGGGPTVLPSIQLALNNRSAWTGASTALDTLALSGNSQWTLTGDASLNALTVHDSLVALSEAGAGGFNTLTVTGDLETQNARILFNGALGDDESAVDRLHVQGDTRGTAEVWVNNVGGQSDQTVNGIQVVQVDGASDADFRLGGRAVGGQYEYFLFKGGVADPADGDWYLRSEWREPTDPCDADPAAAGCTITLPEQCEIDPALSQCGSTPPPPVPVLRPEVGAYLANQVAATRMFGMRLHDRTGGTARGQGEPGAWVRASRSQAEYGVVGGQLEVSGDGNVLQLGTDLFAFGSGGRAHLGLMAGKGRTDSTVTSRLTGYTARGTVQGQALGLYGSWVQDPARTSGPYLDGWVQHARFTHTVQGDALAKEHHDSRAASASLEAGYTVKMFDGPRTTVFVEPQLQVGYTRFSAGDHTEANGTVVNGSDAGGLGSRIGMRVFGHAATEAGNRVQPFASVNWLHESHGNSLRLDGERVSGGVPQDRYEAKAGASLQLGSRWTAWADLGMQRGDGGYRDMSGQVGLRSTW
ncbi:MAG: autotransporter outer membrane beta-barrel domain-containing protein [Stenotrophomonas maltophilia]